MINAEEFKRQDEIKNTLFTYAKTLLVQRGFTGEHTIIRAKYEDGEEATPAYIPNEEFFLAFAEVMYKYMDKKKLYD